MQSEKKRVSFWARLASVSDLSTLPEKEARALKKDLDRLYPFPPQDFHAVHSDARNLTMGLLRGGKPTLPFPVKIWFEKSTLRWGVAEDVSRESLGDLLHILASRPFRSCPECNRLFVTATSKRYCSAHCRYKANARARKVARRKYMRIYMAKRRKAAKKKAQQGRKE